MKKYNIIYADPSWSYRDKARAGNRGAECKYPVMTMEDIKNLPIKDIAADDCVMLMWATFPKMDEIFESKLFEAWGFEYKTAAFTWVKRNRLNLLSWFWGMGRWTRANPEVCLLATRGKPKRYSAGVHSIIEAPIERHSKKPDETRDRIVQLCGDLPRIELFARQRVDGWDAMGYDIDGKSIQERIEELKNADRQEALPAVSGT